MWHEELYNVLNIINNLILTLIGVPFSIQMIYTLLGWLKKKTWKKTEKKNKICV